MDWAANWYEPKLDEEVDPESYDPLEAIALSFDRVKEMNCILSAIRGSDHPEESMPVMRHLRTAFWQTFLAYKSHEAKFHRGWKVPDWMDPLGVERHKTAAKDWSIEEWLSEGRNAAQRQFSVQWSVFHALNLGDLRRSERRVYNTTATLYVYEAERLAWAMDPARK